MQSRIASIWNLSKLVKSAFARFLSVSSVLMVGAPPEQHEHARLSILTALKSCTVSHALIEGRILHAHMVICQTLDVSLNDALITMYGKCGSLSEALSAFDHMEVHAVTSWNAAIAALNLHANYEEAIFYFKRMQEESVQADKITCISVASACANLNALKEGLGVHNLAIFYGFETILELQNAFIHMYGRCMCLETALSIFRASSQDDIISWNAMMCACSHSGLDSLVQELYNQMFLKSKVPNRVSYVIILSVLSNAGAFADGRRIHAKFVGTVIGFETLLGTTLISLYGKGGSLVYACKVFESIAHPTIVSWNALIAAHVHSRESKIAWQMFNQMQQESYISSGHTYACILDSCDNKSALKAGKRLHALVQGSNLEKDGSVGSALINMYSKCGSALNALELFDQLPHCNELVWNIMITSMARIDSGLMAFKFFKQMLQEAKLPDRFTFMGILDACANYSELARGVLMHSLLFGSHLLLDSALQNALINMYSKCGKMPTALENFDTLQEQGVIAWTALISGFVQQGQNEDALFVYYHMYQEVVMPNKITYVSALAACSDHVLLTSGKRIHAFISGSALGVDVVTGNALLNFYGKCGCLGDAQSIFEAMPERDTISWSAMITACALQGKDQEVFQLFNKMQQAGLMPNCVTFLSVIFAWGHTGKIDESYYWFLLMDQKFDIPPVEDHYNCLIDLSGRAGRLDEAEALLAAGTSKLSIISIMALLSACKFQGDVERGERFARHSFALFPENAEPYVMLANIYSWVGRVEDAQKVLSHMRKKGPESACC